MAYKVIQVIAIVDTIEEANRIIAGYDSDDQRIPEIEYTESTVRFNSPIEDDEQDIDIEFMSDIGS